MKVTKNSVSTHKQYNVSCTKIEGADPVGYDWSFSFNYENGRANVYAWVALEGVEDEVEFIISEDDNITHEGAVKWWEKVSKNVFKQAAFVRAVLPDAIACWRVNNPRLEDRLTLGRAEVSAEDGSLAVVADLLVDGKEIYKVLEWLDTSGDLVRDDRHLDVNPYHLDAVREATKDLEYTDFKDRVRIRVEQLLQDALVRLRPPPENHMYSDGEECDEGLLDEILGIDELADAKFKNLRSGVTEIPKHRVSSKATRANVDETV